MTLSLIILFATLITTWAIFEKETLKSFFRKLSIFLLNSIVPLIAIIVLIGAYRFYNNNSNKTLTTFNLPNSAININSMNNKNLPTMPMPENGHISKYTTKEHIAPFNITTPEGENYYYILLKNANTNDTELAFYIYPNCTINFEIPLGRYKLYHTSGKEWYGTNNLFNNNNTVQAENILEFKMENNKIIGMTLILKNQIDGNLHTKPISKEEFNK